MRFLALSGVASVLVPLLVTMTFADEIDTSYRLCQAGKLRPGLYLLNPSQRLDLPESGAVTVPYNARGKLLVVPELETDQKEAAWGVTIRTQLGTPDNAPEVNVSRTAVYDTNCSQTFPKDKRRAWDDDSGSSQRVPYADYEINLKNDRYEDGTSKNLMKKWHFDVSRKDESGTACVSTRDLELAYREVRISSRIRTTSAVAETPDLRKPKGQRLSSALVFRSRKLPGCHSIWVSKFGGTSSEQPMKSTISVSALRSKRPVWRLVINWKAD